MASHKENRVPGRCPALKWLIVSIFLHGQEIENANGSGLEARDFKMEGVSSSITGLISLHGQTCQ